MSCGGAEVEYARIVNKQGNGVPTVPLSDDHDDGSWLDTDMYIGEWYLDLDTDILYIRTSAGIVQVYDPAATPPPAQLVVVLNSTQVNVMNATPQVLYSVPAGKGARFWKLPILKSDSGGTFIFASGETVQIWNAETPFSGNTLATWGDPAVYTDGMWQPQPNFSGFQLVSGDLVVTSTIPVTGGVPGSTMTFYLDIELFDL